jgi:hypothetical protein
LILDKIIGIFKKRRLDHSSFSLAPSRPHQHRKKVWHNGKIVHLKMRIKSVTATVYHAPAV